MTIGLIASTPTTPLLIGGLLSPLQVILMLVFLCSSGFIFTVIKDQLPLTRAIGVSGGLYAFCVAMTFIMV